MSQWKIKQISELTGVSVRMLHHYDEIGLLKPTVRAENGYRLYSEQNLARLQQIVTLKFFGFSLGQIKAMLQQKNGIKKELLAQQQVLDDQVERLHETKKALCIVLQRCEHDKALNWKNFVALIERSKMAQEIKKTWACKLDKVQKQHYIELRRMYPKQVKAWEKVVEQLNGKDLGDAEGAGGKLVAKAFLDYQTITIKQGLEVLTSVLFDKNIISEQGKAWLVKALVAYKPKS